MNEYRIVFLNHNGTGLEYSNWHPADESELYYITYCLNGSSFLGLVYDIETR